MVDEVRVRGGGSGHRVLLLLHGIGATGAVWEGWRTPLASGWPGRWLAPDLPGHGRAAPLSGYPYPAVAAEVAAALGPGDRVVVLGHSYGGVVGLALAGAGVGVEAVAALGVKVAWTPDELARMTALAGRPVTWFPSRAEAAARYLRVSGLAGLVDEADPAVDAGLVERDGRWRLAMDPAAFAVDAPDMPALLAGCRAPVVLARGEHDPMVGDAELAALGVPTATLAGLGHNAHVEDPAAVLDLLAPYR
ncbi:alpha/beta fold hydrolase [Polymorphospora lycopeni]|uniref:Alpha/beta hydrolase n=1 Tax=Polymorphospora lycopeni TaxID=3140240 RepID=A0ABV5CYQ3_9ACTN